MFTTIASDPRIKTDHCPGCGAKFQMQDDLKPGFLVVPKLESKKSLIKPRELDADGVQTIVKSLPEDIIKQLYPMGVAPELESPNKGNDVSYSCNNESMGNTSDKKIEDTTEERIFCQRCYNLRYHNRVVTEEWQESLTSNRSFLSFLKKKKDAVVVTVVDIFDFPGTLLEGLDDLIGTKNPNILVANKMDLLPKDVNETRIKNWLKVNSEKLGFHNIHGIFLISARKNWMVRELAQTISAIRSGFDDIYLIGCANVGKSELLNSFLSTMVGGWKHKVTSSPIPGTTVGVLGLPLTIFGQTFGCNPKGFHFPQESRYIYDTPGVFNGKQLIHLLTEEELKMVIPQKKIKPLTYNIDPGKSLFFGGLGRIDYVEGDKPVRMTIFSQLRPHITSTRRADEICQSMAAGDKTFLEPPVFSTTRVPPFPPMIMSKKGYVLKGVPGTMSSKDVVFSGIGWASFGGTFDRASIDIWSPNGIGIYIRDKSLLPFEFRGMFEKLP